MSNIERRLKVCPNCQQDELEKHDYCPNCGQKNKKIDISILTLIVDFLGDVFTFDSKFFVSLVPLIFRPGQMTKDFISGKRVRYIPPLRLFVFTSVIYFFIFSLSDAFDYRMDFSKAVAAVDANDRNLIVFDPDSAISTDDTVDSNDIQFSVDDQFDFVKFQQLVDKYPPEVVADSIYGSSGRYIQRLFAIQFAKMQGREVGEFLFSKGSLAVFIIIPVFAFLLLLIIARRKYKYITHLIFSLHLHSFVLIWSLIYLVGFVYEFDLPDWFNNIYFLLLFIYLLFSIRNVYELKWWGSVWRSLLIAVLYIPFIVIPYLLSTLLLSFFLS